MNIHMKQRDPVTSVSGISWKSIRNIVMNMIGEAEQSFHDKLVNMLSCDPLSSNDFWSKLKRACHKPLRFRWKLKNFRFE